MLPNCKQVAEQASENIDQPLTGIRWLKMKIHLLMCAYCNRYNKQIQISSNMVSSICQESQPNEDVRINVKKTFDEMHCRQDKHKETD